MNPTRERIIGASAELFRRQGYPATGVKQIVKDASAPFGSLYHFFPGGKEQLAEETIRWSGAQYGELVPAIFDPAPDVATGVRDFFFGAAAHLRDTDYEDACPIATIALEVASTSEPLRRATADVFESWIAALEGRLVGAGIDPDPAHGLALMVLAALEGAFILGRATRSTEALEAAGTMMADLVARALD